MAHLAAAEALLCTPPVPNALGAHSATVRGKPGSRRPRDAAREIWDGARAGLQGATEHFECDKVGRRGVTVASVPFISAGPVGPA